MLRIRWWLTPILLLLLPAICSAESLVEVEMHTAEGCKTVFNHKPREDPGIDRVVWNGRCVDGYAEGSGVMTFNRKDGARQTINGNYRRGRMEGYGEVSEVGKANVYIQYFGAFANGLPVDGLLIVKGLPGGTLEFRGEFRDEQPVFGRIDTESGATYCGEIRRMKPHGKGRLFTPDKRVFIGEFVNGAQAGEGIVLYPDGRRQSVTADKGKLEPKFHSSSVADDQEEFDKFPIFEAHNAEAKLAIARGDLAAAERKLTEARKAAWALNSRREALAADAIATVEFARVRMRQGRYLDAECFFRLAIRANEEIYGARNDIVGNLLIGLSDVLEALGRAPDATQTMVQGLAIKENALGLAHPEIAKVLNKLAELYSAQGKLEQAEPLHRRALAIREIILGKKHPEVAQSLNNLALVYIKLGRYAQADSLMKRALEIYEKAFGLDHPHVVETMQNLAGLYYFQGHYTRAELFYRRVLAVREKSVGPVHPDIAISLNNLAEVYRSWGQYSQAEALYKRSLAINEKIHGLEHRDTAAALNNLAILYVIQGHYAQAELLHKRVLSLFEKANGPEHSDVATVLHNLAGLHVALGQFAEAEPLYKRALAIKEKAFSPDHPDVATSLINLSELYRIQQRYTEAELLAKRALVIRENSLGVDHPSVAESLNALALLYFIQGVEFHPNLTRGFHLKLTRVECAAV